MMSLIIKFKKVIETLRKSTFLASFLISVSIGLIDIGKKSTISTSCILDWWRNSNSTYCWIYIISSKKV